MSTKSESPKPARTTTAAPPHATVADSSEDDRKTRPYAAEASEPTGRVPQRNEVDAETGGEGMELDIDVGTEDVTDEAIEGSGQHAGMGRGEKPRKLKSEEK